MWGSNLITLIESIPPYWSTLREIFHTRVGNPETEEEFLKSRSPLSFVERIRTPVLIAQGANDPRVKQAESEQIVAAMKEKGIDYEYLLFEDEATASPARTAQVHATRGFLPNTRRTAEDDGSPLESRLLNSDITTRQEARAVAKATTCAHPKAAA